MIETVTSPIKEAEKEVKLKEEVHEDPNIGGAVAFMTYLSYAILIVIGHVRDFLGACTGMSRYHDGKPKPGYGVLFKSWESFFTRRLYHRIQDCWNRPISSNPGAYIDVIKRYSSDNNCTMSTTDETIHCLNLGSYNYLGFADDWGSTCRDRVMKSVREWPISMCASRAEGGTLRIHKDLEETVARFLKKEAALVYTMGYGTNSATIPALLGKGDLIVSDALNHTSLVNGARACGAAIRVFKHNDAKSLEEILREAITNGVPRRNRPWRKIMVMVEGIYSMEGAICNLKEIARVTKKYRAYLYVDEAHSIGALGATGRGICEYTGVDPDDVDILMGTFTKSFGGMGGYICSSKRVVDFLRATSAGAMYHNSLSPTVCEQVLTSFRIIMGEDGSDLGARKIRSLRENSNFFRTEMLKAGMHVYGDFDSPIIPVMIYFPAKIAAFSRECLARGVAIVVVGFPATSVILSRARFCISAAHTKDDIVHAVRVIAEVSDLLGLRYANSTLGF